MDPAELALPALPSEATPGDRELQPGRGALWASLGAALVLAIGAGAAGSAIAARDIRADIAVLLAARLGSADPGAVTIEAARVDPLGALRLRGVQVRSDGALLGLGRVELAFSLEDALRGRVRLLGALSHEVSLRAAPGERRLPAGLSMDAREVALRREGRGYRVIAAGARLQAPGLPAIFVEHFGVALDSAQRSGAPFMGGRRPLRAAASGVSFGGIGGGVGFGPAQLLWTAAEDGGRFRGALFGAELRGAANRDGIEARLDLSRVATPPLRNAVVDLRRAQLGGGLHLRAFRDGGGVLGFNGMTLEGRLSAAGLGVDHPALSAAPLSGLSLTIEGALAAEQTPRGLRLESSGLALHIGDLHAALSGSFAPQVAGAWRLDVEFSLRELDCSALLRSLPRALVPKLDGLGVAGRIGGRLGVSADSRLLPVVSVDNDIRIGCRVLRDPPLADVHELWGPRLMIERPGPDGALRRLPLASGVTTEEGEAGFVPLSTLPWPVQRAFLVAEDNLFFAHQGFDGTMIIRALGLDLQDQQAARGASTISQQVAKNLWLGQERSLGRKLEETVLTWRLEQVVQKPRILEVYLNLAELGSGIYGVGQAAQHYFRVPAETLTREQAAQLAALLPAPRRGMDSAWAKRYRELVQRLPRVKIPKAPPELVEKAE